MLPPRVRQIRDDAAGDRIARPGEHDRDGRRGPHRGARADGRSDHQHVDPQSEQLVDQHGQAFGTPFGESHLDTQVAPVGETRLAQAPHEGFISGAGGRRGQEPDAIGRRCALRLDRRRRPEQRAPGYQELPAPDPAHVPPPDSSRLNAVMSAIVTTNAWVPKHPPRGTIRRCPHPGRSISIMSRATTTSPLKCLRTPSAHIASVIEVSSPGTR